MIIGQERTGKTSLKRSLKGELLDPDEGSTVGIEVDPSYFNISTDVWRIGKKSKDTEQEPKFSFEHQAAQWILENFQKESTVFSNSEESSHSRMEPSLEEPKEISEKPITSGFCTSKEDVAALVQRLLENDNENEDDVYSIIWDFGGQSVYYDIHPIFLTEKAIYILVCDLSRDPYQKGNPPIKTGMFKKKMDTWCSKTNFDYLDFWMSSVYSLINPDIDDQETLLSKVSPPVFLVCTHADMPYCSASPKDLAREIFVSLKGKVYGKLLKDFFVVDNTKSGSDHECEEVKNLREAVLSVAKELPQMKKTIPLKWLKYEKVLHFLNKEGYKWISIAKARQIAFDECGIDDDEQFRKLLNFLHDQRILIHFSESPELENIVILSPQWLIDIFKEVITVKPYNKKNKRFTRLWRDFEKTGILGETLLNHAWRPLSDNLEFYDSLIAIMERFSLLCAWPSDGTTQKYLVPSMLMSPPTDSVLKLLDCVRTPSLFVVFQSGRVPPGLFSRIVLQFHRLCQEEWKSEINPALFNSFARFHILPDLAISLVFMLHASSIEIIFHDGQDAGDLNTSRTICSQLKYLLEHICKEFFWLKHVKYKMCVCCPVCSQEDGVTCRAHDMRGCECLHLLSESELRERPYCNKDGSYGYRTITITMFEHWFALSDTQGSRIPIAQVSWSVRFPKHMSFICHSRNYRNNRYKCLARRFQG